MCAHTYMCPLSPAEASLDYPDHEKDQMFALDTLAAYFVQLARSEKEKTRRREFFTKVGVGGGWGWGAACKVHVEYMCVSVPVIHFLWCLQTAGTHTLHVPVSVC